MVTGYHSGKPELSKQKLCQPHHPSPATCTGTHSPASHHSPSPGHGILPPLPIVRCCLTFYLKHEISSLQDVAHLLLNPCTLIFSKNTNCWPKEIPPPFSSPCLCSHLLLKGMLPCLPSPNSLPQVHSNQAFRVQVARLLLC